MFDLATKRKINKGFSDGYSRAVEIVATPVLLGLLGALVDGWLGTRPVFTIGLATFGVCGIFTKLWLGYDREMKVEEAKLTASRAGDGPRSGDGPRNLAPPAVDMTLEPGIGATGDLRTGVDA